MSNDLSVFHPLVPVQADLSPELQQNLAASLASNTRLSYQKLWARFQAETGLALPVSPLAIAEYISQAKHQRTGELLSVSTIRALLVAIGKAHTINGYENPCQYQGVRMALQGIRRLRGNNPRQAQAITLEVIRDIVRIFGDSLKDQRNQALLLVGFFTAMRRCELAALTVEDIQFNAHGMQLIIRRSKTDQEGQGHRIH